ncbi:MAG: hypothetical protein B7C24_00740 [Bacteroidetes bacterium 4572_77]|nr:MAG: hypothetical protein B7C24_00740 [Bacteroidetes bacterium 4572_77]
MSLFVLSFCTKTDKPKEPAVSDTYPVAAFAFEGNQGPAPVTVQFINHCEAINLDSTYYTWTFGEHGPQSHETNPAFTFHNNTNQLINYPVKLTVLDLISDLSQTRTFNVPVNPADK